MIWLLTAWCVQAGEWEELRAIWRELPRVTQSEQLARRIERHFEPRVDSVSIALRDVLLAALPAPGIRKSRDPSGLEVYTGSPGSSGDDTPEEGMGGSFLRLLGSGCGTCANYGVTWSGYRDDYDPTGPWAVHHSGARRFALPEGCPAWVMRRLVEVLRALDCGEVRPRFDDPTQREERELKRDVARLADDNIDVREAAQGRLLLSAGLAIYRNEAVVTFLLGELDRAGDPEVRSRLQSILDRL